MIRTAEPVSPVRTRLRAAVGAAVAGALLTAVAPVVGVVDGSAPPAFTAWPALAPLALLPTALAVLFLARGQELTAAAALVAPAVFAVGRLFADLQLLVDPIDAARPELMRPTSLDPPGPAAGLWLLLAGHVLLIGAGLLATLGAEPDARGERANFALPATAGIVAGIGLFTAPFTSSDALIPARGAVDSPTLPMVGGLVLTLAAPALAVLAASATTHEARRGGLLGLAAVLLSCAVPPIAAAVAVDALGLAVGPFLVLAGAVALAWPQRAVRDDKNTEERDVELPGQRRLHVIAGTLGLIAAAMAAVGASTDHLVLPDGSPPPVDYAARLLWPAAIATGVLAAALLAKAAVRPAFTVAVATIPLSAAGALDAVFTATRVDVVQPGAGVWFTAGSVVAAAAAAVTAALAGAVERDEVGTAPAEPPLPLLAAALIAALLAVGAFALPVLRAPDYVAIGAFGLRVGSFGLLVALLAVVVAAVVALRARPGRGAALLLGAAVVTAVRAWEYPLTAARAAEAAPGPGLWLAAAATAAFVIAGALRTAR
ncbi:hypothetical protein IOD16_33150 [Saccharothrix sp. 6-C]|uniref:Uncharacterized protein n=1 Tax=Saccharothrix texasensis TaxID=103734 RepID=A0A3N1HBU4_9PSEU|nr:MULTISPECIES: hypothetical protein [Saccharothrix]QQQ75861.1 hypothetical protein IOD16_33150 [Saccharothrix sp. 6-C]ROP39979.1 hypothetical protein EDD40_5381 [Saccharothrix texasensis]